MWHKEANNSFTVHIMYYDIVSSVTILRARLCLDPTSVCRSIYTHTAIVYRACITAVVVKSSTTRGPCSASSESITQHCFLETWKKYMVGTIYSIYTGVGIHSSAQHYRNGLAVEQRGCLGYTRHTLLRPPRTCRFAPTSNGRFDLHSEHSTPCDL